jgi:hypothetical protein
MIQQKIGLSHQPENQQTSIIKSEGPLLSLVTGDVHNRSSISRINLEREFMGFAESNIFC